MYLKQDEWALIGMTGEWALIGMVYTHTHTHTHTQDPADTPAPTRGETKEERIARKVISPPDCCNAGRCKEREIRNGGGV